jgi:hypothetical protein
MMSFKESVIKFSLKTNTLKSRQTGISGLSAYRLIDLIVSVKKERETKRSWDNVTKQPSKNSESIENSMWRNEDILGLAEM